MGLAFKLHKMLWANRIAKGGSGYSPFRPTSVYYVACPMSLQISLLQANLLTEENDLSRF
uniref:Uncharacterized protein n=1 Tax=Picea sitchensis TaxID=3332 RepID=B8LRJ8_PICSI|nr:unknown [Picea sitchensis]